ncbi:MAG TPA: YqgE/AlgH family protein [Egibacteraceae bacterium]|jgi:putative transcriptional regulator|nr:YqgE/AlgH family protein [Egibacteraceae bacterium]
MSTAFLTGRFVVATPALTDGNFAHTVVLLLEHKTDGAVGVVVNRATDAALSVALPRWATLAAEPAVVFAGGPVQPDALIGLARTYGPPEGDGLAAIFPGVGVVDLSADPTLLGAAIAGVRVFAGYAGWGGGQLETEIAAGSWFVVDARAEDVFTEAPGALWRGVLRRQGGVFTTIPADPTAN